MRSVGAFIGFVAAFLASVLFVSCAGTESSRPQGVVKTHIDADPLRICQASVDVLTRYSYTLANTNYPVALSFVFNGSPAVALAPGGVATIDVCITPLAAGGCEVTLQASKGSFSADQLKDVLARIKAEALSRQAYDPVPTYSAV